MQKNQRRYDERTSGQIFFSYLKTPPGYMLISLLLMGGAWLTLSIPYSGEFFLLLTFFCLRAKNPMRQLYDFSYRVPIFHAIQLKAASQYKWFRNKNFAIYDGSYPRPTLAHGDFYLGVDTDKKQRIYATRQDMRTHALVLGTTGSGKTELLLSFVANALAGNSGFIFIDGKGDGQLARQVLSLMRHFGREDDLFVVHFMQSNTPHATHSIDLMSQLNAGSIAELLVSLLDDSQDGMWKGRAISLIYALSQALVYLRDVQHQTLSPQTFLDHLPLDVCCHLIAKYTTRDGMPSALQALSAYLKTLPNFNIDQATQDATTLEQHGYIIMQLTRALSDLSFNYGHIFNARVPDIDFTDVVRSRRGLLILLPALERSPDTLKMLGKLMVGAIKNIMATALHESMQAIPNKSAQQNFYIILDEYGYYSVPGFAVAPAQARSLGFSIIFASQDFSSLQKGSKEEADATWENTNIKMIGRLVSGKESETWRRIAGLIRDEDTALLGGYDLTHKTQQVQYEKRALLEYDAFAQQQDGQFTYIFSKKQQGQTGQTCIVTGQAFFTDIKPSSTLPLSQGMARTDWQNISYMSAKMRQNILAQTIQYPIFSVDASNHEI